MGFKKSGSGVPNVSSMTLRMVLADAASSEPAKVVARRVGISDRHVRNIATGRTKTSAEVALAFADQYPKVRQFFAHMLALETLDPRTEALLAAMRAYEAAQPEAGDREQPT